MASGLDRVLGRISASEASLAVRRGAVSPLFQPIEALQTGETRGFEALARLRRGDELVPPNAFLETLSADDRLSLFGVMLGESIALLKRRGEAFKDLYISINVEISLLVGDDFVDILQYFLERYDFSGERLVLEILENEEVTDFSRLAANLDAVRRLGISVALDDIGSAYASLAKIRDLPIDIFKLDRSFSRDLEMHPEDLMFVLSIQSLARGLGRNLVVEGIETAEVYDALRILGVELGQGYAIAPPMTAAEAERWVASRRVRSPSQAPLCLLGAYASLLNVVESCRCLRRQPLPIVWTRAATDHRNCVVGKLFEARGWHETTFGEAHRRFHEVLPFYDKDEAGWTGAARAFLDTMAQAITERPHEMRCEPVDAPEPAAKLARPRAPATPRVSKRRAAAR